MWKVFWERLRCWHHTYGNPSWAWAKQWLLVIPNSSFPSSMLTEPLAHRSLAEHMAMQYKECISQSSFISWTCHMRVFYVGMSIGLSYGHCNISWHDMCNFWYASFEGGMREPFFHPFPFLLSKTRSSSRYLGPGWGEHEDGRLWQWSSRTEGTWSTDNHGSPVPIL